MREHAGEWWQFTVDQVDAERLYLVKESHDGGSNWLEMRRAAPGQWELIERLTTGRYRFRYYTVEGSVFINAGTTGLGARRVAGDDPSITVEAAEAAAPAAATAS